MSQAGIINFEGSHPEVPTSFVTNSGTAVPVANTLNILGTIVASHSIPLETTGSGNTVTVVTQYASAAGSSVGTNAGMASFNSTFFTVDANGFVTLSGTGSGETITGNSGGALSPTAGNWNILGSGSITTSGAASTLTIQLSGLTNHAVQVGGSATTLTQVGPSVTTGAVLASNGAAADPSFQTIASLGATTTFTGNTGGAESPLAGNFNILGTGSITVAGSANTETVQLTGLTNHAVLVGAGTATITKVGPTATAGQVLQSAGASADPVFSTATYPSTTTINQILYSSATNVVSGLATVNNGVLITSATGVPSILPDGTTGQVLTATTGSPPSWASPATSGTVTSVSVVTANGFAGTVATATTTPAITLTTTQTGLLTGNGTSITGTAITQYNVITAGASNLPNSVPPSATSGVPLVSQGAAAQPIFGTAVVAGGGTGSTSFNTNGVVISGTSSTAALTSLSLTSGQVVIGGTSTPAAATLTAGAGISITNGNNSITIAASGAGFTWSNIAVNTNAVAENGYRATAALTLTLPNGPADGVTIKIQVKTASAVIVAAQGSGTIRMGPTIGAAAGSATSTGIGQTIELVYDTANTNWCAQSFVGNWTLV